MDGNTTLQVLFGLGLGAAACLVVVNGQTPPKLHAFEVASSAAQGTDSQAAPSSDSGSPSVQEQLELKLDAQRGPVDVVVIESAERPVED
jgi:uncharacterized protein (TIGR03435 family)